MGSTGSGSFSDYSGRVDTAGSAGGTSGEDKCDISFSTLLEDVQQAEYFSQNNQLPPQGSEVFIQFSASRIMAIERQTGLSIGALPTRFNYLLSCLESGYSYIGIINKSSNSPLPLIQIDISPLSNE